MLPESITREIPLTRGFVAIVDEADYARVAQFKWRVLVHSDNNYAVRSHSKAQKPRPTIYLHRFVMDAPQGVFVDHIDGNGLNCRRSNLRLCSNSENARNRGAQPNSQSGYKGVTWHKSHGKWRATIAVEGKQTHIGYFGDPINAAHAYDDKARELHGQFASTNF